MGCLPPPFGPRRRQVAGFEGCCIRHRFSGRAVLKYFGTYFWTRGGRFYVFLGLCLLRMIWSSPFPIGWLLWIWSKIMVRWIGWRSYWSRKVDEIIARRNTHITQPKSHPTVVSAWCHEYSAYTLSYPCTFVDPRKRTRSNDATIVLHIIILFRGLFKWNIFPRASTIS